jgi:hypothetical protein
MTTLAEIEAATETLSLDQKKELVRFLAAQLRCAENPPNQARLVPGPEGTMLLVAPPGAPPMTTQTIKQMLEDFP